MTLHVGIIGGGCTGIACATDLIQQGVRVTLLEKNPYLGGLAGGFRCSHWNSSLEHFYHHWFKSDSFVREYATTFGLQKDIVFKRPITVMETKQNGFAQLDSPWSLLMYPELSWFSKFRMALALAAIKSMKSWTKLEQVTAQQWCESNMGKEGFSELWQPLLRGKFGDEWAGKVNMAWFWARLACRTPELGTYCGGFQKFFDDAEVWMSQNGVRIFKEQSSIDASQRDGKWEVATPEQTFQFDKLVVATGTGAFASLCGKDAPSHAAKLVNRPSLGAHVVILALKKPVGKYYWYNLRKTINRPFLALIEHTNFVSATEFGGEHIVYLADYLDTSSKEWYRTDAETTQLALKTLQFVNPEISADDVINARVFRDAYAQPVVGVNAAKHLPPLRVLEAPNLFHGSMSHIYPWDRGTNFAFELGKKLAREVLT